MFKVNISNASQNLSWSASFETEQLAQDWLAQQIGKPHRLPEREVSISDEYSQDDVLEVIQTEVVIGYENGDPILDEQNNPVLDEQGNPTYIQVPITELQDTHVRLRAQFASEIIDITASHNDALNKANKILEGKKAREACSNVLDLVAGYNLANNLTAEQITSMMATFGSILQLLQANRPSTAKALIDAITPDGVIVTEQMKQDCLDLLSEY